MLGKNQIDEEGLIAASRLARRYEDRASLGIGGVSRVANGI
jgi:hypothetical protein